MTPNKMERYDDEMALTVPTHMWTQFVCHHEADNRVIEHFSYIGLNYRTGIVKVHDNGITDILKKMYYGTGLNFQPESAMKNAEMSDSGKITGNC